MQTSGSSAVIGLYGPLPTLRLVVFAALAVVEVGLTSLLFGFPSALSYWWNPVSYANMLARLAALALPLLVMVAWPLRREILDETSAAFAEHKWQRSLLINIGLFAALLSTRFALSQVEEPSVLALAAYSSLLLATGASLALVAAPASFWHRLVTVAPIEVSLALFGSGIALGASKLAQEGWEPLSSATMTLSHWLLTLYESNVVLDAGERILGVGTFTVKVYAPCSGYEGIGLIVAVLTIYLWAFRRELRFPNALLLYPVGIAAIWLLNAVRIAALVSIGAHVSPTIAVEGFHSQGGWITFLLVTLAAIALSRKVSFFAARPAGPARTAVACPGRSGADAALEMLAPFMALMAASVLASAFAPHDQWLYAVKVAAVGAVLWWFRGVYAPLLSAVSPLSIAAGLAVGALWIATDPGRGTEAPLGVWLASLPLWLAALWLMLRALGSIVLVPVAEELAFRGYLHRVLISPRFETIGFGEYRLLAFVGSSLAFGLMHQRWLAAALAGAVYALLMYRTKRLSDPIAAHISSNALIMVWAVAAEQWSLL